MSALLPARKLQTARLIENQIDTLSERNSACRSYYILLAYRNRTKTWPRYLFLYSDSAGT
ncbi:hypothetical protein PRUB_a3338 [Pseudoalteromonas rubra]|uniref:Uncharacterized protein n=1 Tax=Pseudoalteromonas rubra TaxID=43658 RepID=A0A8T0C4M6_9GAMM|nr:hypothetical protein PRUB_a3338 [Pseudoalteromonas rubra]